MIKKTTQILLSLILFYINSLYSQDTTRILFVGNSLTFYFGMPSTVCELARSAKIPVYIDMYAPGGYDFLSYSGQDSTLFKVIRSTKWDYVVLQDNQTRFANKYGVFTDGILNANLRLMDSVKAVNKCARIIWFGGWCYEGGYTGTFPDDNTEKAIRRILENYTYLNTLVDEIIAPIGEAWIHCLNEQPSILLYLGDSVHPSISGSFLTASVIYTTIFKADPTRTDYIFSLHPDTAQYLKQLAYQIVMDSANFHKYNLFKYNIPLIVNNNIISTGEAFGDYRWYRNAEIIEGAENYIYTANKKGLYQVETLDSSGCKKSSLRVYLLDSLDDDDKYNPKTKLEIFPNPSHDRIKISYTIHSSTDYIEIYLYNLLGQRITLMKSGYTKAGSYSEYFNVGWLASSVYFAVMKTDKELVFRQFVVK